MVVVKPGGILVHNLMGNLNGIMMFKLRLDCVVGNFVRVLLDKQILDSPVANSSLVDSKGSGELPMLTYPDFVEHVHGEILAVVVDQIIGWAFLAHIEDDHLA